MFKSRSQKGNIRKRACAEETQDVTPDEAAPAPKKKVGPVANPNFHQTDKTKKKILDYEPATEEFNTKPSASDLAVATTQIDTEKINNPKKYGPMKAPTNVRVTMRVDYEPNICKDYYETGYCGFGDSCKFAHVREDYKSGWQIEKEYQEELKRKQAKLQGLGLEGESEDEEGDEGDDGLPHACWICREEFKNPVVTRCKHYFCEACAMDHFRVTQRCAACELPTNGIFNTAHDIMKKMALMQRKKDEIEAEDADEEQTGQATERIASLCSSSWSIPSDFSDNRKGKSNWI
mmetsp:Transcript_152537/g.266318  ORF Transcript_152537/g.266318 Transcript_152537/m.266318 type:complete len:291 (-) Transcript_152537:338-1210(-)